MMIDIRLSKLLRAAANNQEKVTVKGETIGECLQDLVSQHPNINTLLFDDEGSVQKYIIIFLNQKIAYPKELDIPITPGDDVYLEFFVDGG